jgi:hypothetical protein
MKDDESHSRLVVGGTEYSWHVERYPRQTSEGFKGICVHVQVANQDGRLLVIEFPFEERDHRTMPHHQRPTPSKRAMTVHIGGAIAAGWKPESRGRPFVYAVGRSDAA